MQTRIKATKLELTAAIKSYIETKLATIDKYLGEIKAINCDVEVGRVVGSRHKGDIFRMEVNLEVPHKLLRVEKTEKDLYKAIDKVKDHLELVVKKYKEKLIDKRRGQ
ncbi:MAG: ribosome-associated translation inhibitor RaiA [Patescibacteria group bacterium]